ncbi:MAG: Rpn family recombination-promoting nuclease/putative transposase [Saprospiraceae bacterium]
MENKIDKPHDHFFRATFSKKLVAKEFILNFLSEEISANLDLASLKLDNGTYVDEKLAENISDLVYSCNWQGQENTTVKISFLWEHKSYIPKYPQLQLLRYQLNAWEQQYQNGENLEVIIPIIVYHGKRKWKYKDFKVYFPYYDEQLSRFIPKFDYLLTDLSSYSNEELKQIKLGFLGAALLLMKNNKDADFIKNKTAELLVYAWKSTPNELFETFIRIAVVYIANASPIEKEEIKTITNNLPLKLDDMVKTAYEQFVDEGILIGEKKGEKKGEEKGRKQKELLTILQLTKKFPLMKDEEIAQIAMTNSSYVHKLRKTYLINDKKKHKEIAQKLLKLYPTFKNKEIAILLGKTTAVIQKIRKELLKTQSKSK